MRTLQTLKESCIDYAPIVARNDPTITVLAGESTKKDLAANIQAEGVYLFQVNAQLEYSNHYAFIDGTDYCKVELVGQVFNSYLPIINDYYTPFPRANSYHHKEGLFTYKQDYALPFLSLNTYTEIYRNLGKDGSTIFDKDDKYDVKVMVAVLQKDLSNRYSRFIKK